jgi:hypothetical protein
MDGKDSQGLGHISSIARLATEGTQECDHSGSINYFPKPLTEKDGRYRLFTTITMLSILSVLTRRLRYENNSPESSYISLALKSARR